MVQDNKALQKANNEEVFKNLLKKYESQIKAALPEHVTPERMLRVIKTAVSLNPKLMECSPLSVIAAIVQSSQYGLDIGMMNQAFIVPRWNGKTQRMEACFQIGYGGCIELAMRTGKIKMVQPRLVLKQDKFSIRYKPSLEFDHEIAGSPTSRRNPNDIIGAYLATEFESGGIQIDWMPKEDVDHIRDTYGPRDRKNQLVGPWIDEYAQMALKTAVHNGAKWIPKSTELGMALQKESRIDSGEAPEFVVLDITAVEADNAQLEAGTQASTERLKTNLKAAQEKQSTRAAQEVPHKVTQEAIDRAVEENRRTRAQQAANGGPEPPPSGTSDGPTTAAEGSQQGHPPRPPDPAVGGTPRTESDGPPRALPRREEFPNDEEEVEDGQWINIKGQIYFYVAEDSAWKHWGKDPSTPAVEKPKFGQRPARGRQSDAGDFA